MNSQTKHTPGPWEFDPAYYEVNDTAGRRIAVVNYNDPVEVKQENARLIAAAPDMLNALEIALATIKRLDSRAKAPSAMGTIDIVEAAIAKAMGE